MAMNYYLNYSFSYNGLKVVMTVYKPSTHEVAGNVFDKEGEKLGFFRWRNPGQGENRNKFPIFFPVDGAPVKGCHQETVAAKAAAESWSAAGKPLAQQAKPVQKPAVKAAPAPKASPKQRRGINNWNEIELVKLGFSYKIAKAIVEEREANGPFSGPEDLVKRVKGLGPKTWEKVQEVWRENHAPKTKETAKAASSEA